MIGGDEFFIVISSGMLKVEKCYRNFSLFPWTHERRKPSAEAVTFIYQTNDVRPYMEQGGSHKIILDKFL
jgi:hypothetical protein